MENSIANRRTYRPSMRVAWASFLPWAGATLLVTLFLALAMSWLFSKGWYLLILAPAASAVFVTVFVSFTIQNGKCRMPAFAGAFGFLMGVLLYLAYFYFGMLSFLGIASAGRIDLLPRYILLRIHSDVQKDVGTPDEKPVRPDAVMTGFTFVFEFGFVLVITTVPAYRRARRAFCEKCDEWKLQELARYAPGSGAMIRQWLEEGQLAKLAAIPQFTPTSAKQPLTLAAVEWCGRLGWEGCSAYFAVKDISRQLGLTVQFDESFGKVTIPRVELTAAERAALTPIFPKLAGPAGPLTTTEASARGAAGLIEVKPIPTTEAHKVLNKSSIAVANAASIMILFAFLGSLAGLLGAIQLSQVEKIFQHQSYDVGYFITGLVLAVMCLVVAIFSGYVGLKNPGIGGDLWYRRQSRKAIALRRNKLVDPQRPSDLPTFFVGMTPRKNWGKLMGEMSEDIGFLQIDPRRGELRFEGDVQQYRIPVSAITSCALESYSASAGNTRIEYWAVVVQGKTAQGFWEAPFYPRKTRWLLPPDHRRQSAEQILEQIKPMLPPELAEAPDQNAEVAAVDPSMSGAPATVARSRFGSRLILRLVVVLLAVGFGVWRGIANKPTGSESSATDGDSDAKLVLQATNVRSGQRLIEAPPYFAEGGDWTVFDCAAADDPQAKFTVAVEKPAPATGGIPVSLSHAEILPGDREGGSRLVDKFAAAFGQDVPERLSPQLLQPLKLVTAVLGENLSSPQQGSKPSGGTWVNTKWFIQNAGLDGEIFFDYDLARGQAEFSEKDPDYDEDVTAGIAAALRDGPRPLRTPQNDPNFTNDGPQVTDVREIPDSAKHTASFAPGGKLLVLCGGSPTTITAVSLDNPTERTTLGQFDGIVIHVLCADPDANALLVSEHLGKDQFSYDPSDTERVWWIHRSKNVRQQLKGAWGDHAGLNGGDKALSPDGRYAAIGSRLGTVLDHDRKPVIYLVDVQTGVAAKAAQDNCMLTGWTGIGPSLRAVLADNLHLDNPSKRMIWLVDPITGAATPGDASSLATSDPMISPDHHFKLVLHPKTSFDLVDLVSGTTRTFQFHPDDRRFAVPGNLVWLSSRYIRFESIRSTCIDVTAMKMSYLPTVERNGRLQTYQFGPNFMSAIAFQKTGVSIGRVALPNY